ncbi:glycosyltransferase [Croceimicrobium sp.]|uniref:glycosyltransferase n=1 Tax=Croceimicrobium sp. TaxID=2828340 RepID=UPI003BA8CCD8
MTKAFSVILPFYRGDQPEHLNAAIQSLVDQSLRAEEIVLIQDGPVPSVLSELVAKWQVEYPEIKSVILEENQGLSQALNAGIKAAKHEWLARMDADDICLPDRFEKQWALIEEQPELTLLGSWIEEYDEQMEKSMAIRRLPEKHAEILHYARWRCPFNHMTVMYRKSVLMALGMYSDYGAVGDDYELWARFLMKGYRSANIQEVLVKARTGKAMFAKRRRGWKYLKNELQEIRDLYRLGLLKPWHFVFHITLKSIVRLAPPFMVRWIYKGIRKTS